MFNTMAAISLIVVCVNILCTSYLIREILIRTNS